MCLLNSAGTYPDLSLGTTALSHTGLIGFAGRGPVLLYCGQLPKNRLPYLGFAHEVTLIDRCFSNDCLP